MTATTIASRRRIPRVSTTNPAALLPTDWQTAKKIGLPPATLFALVNRGQAELLPRIDCYLYRKAK